MRQIIQLKCQVISKILTSYDNAKDLMIDYIEKWHLHCCFLNTIQIHFQPFDTLVNQFYEHKSLFHHSFIEAKFSLWRLSTRIWVDEIFRPL